ncbi:GIY-YIG domain-containing protein [Kroppenstedtia guangzhouensis]|uniref:GIY-YIG domain-containing protein n=1 Tax=Kroppenstedtia guangzhouensis TaxID=1274356 RepID=A0ABQ1GYY7_9BACL|nr:GIY-YIG nuclease family protein [Kroppenstedtia guangzhouensis]GGA52469.1 GIY-YIG domain-containing protein [Kroppenstedtia guangzhouensis]
MEKNYVVYILECGDGTLYTGITNNLKQRLTHHRKGTGAKYTRGRGPFTLKWLETGITRSQALRREREIKKMSRTKKLEMIQRRPADEATEEF